MILREPYGRFSACKQVENSSTTRLITVSDARGVNSSSLLHFPSIPILEVWVGEKQKCLVRDEGKMN